MHLGKLVHIFQRSFKVDGLGEVGQWWPKKNGSQKRKLDNECTQGD